MCIDKEARKLLAHHQRLLEQHIDLIKALTDVIRAVVLAVDCHEEKLKGLEKNVVEKEWVN